MSSPKGHSNVDGDLDVQTPKKHAHFQDGTEEIPSPSARSDDAEHAAAVEELAEGLKGSSLQQHRLTHFDYQPFSLPPSRVGLLSIPSPRVLRPIIALFWMRYNLQ